MRHRSAPRPGPASTSSRPSDIEKAAKDAGLSTSTTNAIVDDYEKAQLVALKAGLLAAALLALGSLAFTADLPHELPKPDEQETEPAAA